MSRLKTFRVLCSIIGIIYLKWERERILYRSDCHPGDHNKKSTLKNTNKTVLQNGMGEIRSPNYMLRRPEATMESWSFCLSLGVPQLFVVSLLLTLSCVYPGYSLLSSAYKISG